MDNDFDNVLGTEQIDTEQLPEKEVEQPQEKEAEQIPDPEADSVKKDEPDSVPVGDYELDDAILPMSDRDWMYEEFTGACRKSGIPQKTFSKLTKFAIDNKFGQDNFLADAEKYAVSIGLTKGQIEPLGFWYKNMMASFEKKIEKIREVSMKSRGKPGSVNRAILILREMESKAFESKKHSGHKKSMTNLRSLYEGKNPYA